MGVFKRICLVEPDRWAGSIGLALRQKLPGSDIVSVGNLEVAQTCRDLGVANGTTDSLAEGLQECDLIVVSRKNADPAYSLDNVVGNAPTGATICGHGRGLEAINQLLATMNREDLHYISIEPRDMLAGGNDLWLASINDVVMGKVALTPGKVDDLDALSTLLSNLRPMDSKVITQSPRAHDRLQAESIHLPRILLVPLVQYFTEKSTEAANPLSENPWLLSAFDEYYQDETTSWLRELNLSSEHLVTAIDQYQAHLGNLVKDLASGQMGARMSMILQKISDLNAVPQAPAITEESPEKLEMPKDESPEALMKMADFLLSAVSRLEKQSQSGATTSAESIRQLAEQAHATLEKLTQVNPVAQTIEAAVETVAEAPQMEISAPAEVIMEAAGHEQETFVAPEPEVASEPPAAVEYPWEDPSVNVDWDVPEAGTEEPTEEMDIPMMEHSSFSDLSWQEPEESKPSPQPDLDGWDLKIHDRPELQVMQRASRVLAAARIVIRNVERASTDQGVALICISLSNSTQKDRAREVLERAGITFE